MSDENIAKASTVSRRQAIGGGIALAAISVAATPAWATRATDPRLSIYEGKYAIDSHKIVEGYFAAPRGRTELDVLVVIPGENGIDDAVRDLVRRHALAGNVVIAPDLAKTAGTAFASRNAMIADFMSNAPRLKRIGHSNGNLKLIAA